MTLSLKKYDVENLVDDTSILLVGKKATGKTMLAQYLLSQFPDLSRGVVFSSNGADYGYDHQEIEVVKEYDGERMKVILEEQKEKIRRNRKGDSKEDIRMFVVLDDDMIYHHRADATLSQLIMNNRRYKIFVIAMIQTPNLPPALRTNFDMVFLFRENTLNQRRMLYENFGGMLEKFEQFNMILEHCTEDYGTLVIDQTSTKHEVDKMMFWFVVDKEFVDTQEVVEENPEEAVATGGNQEDSCVVC